MKNGELTFSDSPMFGRVMADADICKGVIEAVLGIPLDRIEYINAEQVIDPLLGSKGVRMDVYARSARGVYDVEMQTYHRKNLGKRLRYYQASMDVAALERGRPYDLLPESYLIMMCNFDPFGARIPVYAFEMTCREREGVKLGHGYHWLVLNAGAWRALSEGTLRSMLQYVSTGERLDDDLVMRIDEAVQNANRDAAWKERAMQILTYEEDLAMQKDMILREGKAEGIRQGRAEGREIGKAEGMREGRDEERARYGRLVQRLFAAGRQDDILRAAEDDARLEELYREFDI